MLHRWSKWIFLLAALGFFTLAGCLLLLYPQKTFSESENRYLTKFQPVTLQGFLDASVQENLTDASNDQFFARDFWMKLSVSLKRALGQEDAGGVYFGREGYYFERVMDKDLSLNRWRNNLRFVDRLASDSGLSVTFLPAPSAGTVLEDLLPESASLYDADRLYRLAGHELKNARLLDLRDFLREEADAGKQVYFKTDHHWTTYGAYEAYKALCQAQGEKAGKIEDFQLSLASDAFFGTLYSKAPGFGTKPDQLVLPKEPEKIRVSIDGKPQAGLYVKKKLKAKDKYGVYFGGNFAKVLIDTGKKGPRLMLIKDSFANSLIPYLVKNYSQILMLDLRYENESVKGQVKSFGPDQILVLYEMSNFARDMNLFKITK